MANQYLTDFSKLELKTFYSAGFGLVVHALPTWLQGDDADVFQLKDPATGTEIAASAYQNPGIGQEQWASLRNEAVSQTMPYLQLVKKPHALEGVGWSATAAEYEGVFPGGTEPRHYWLLCWRTDAMVISLSLTADKAVFDENRTFYRWLCTHLRFLFAKLHLSKGYVFRGQGQGENLIREEARAYSRLESPRLPELQEGCFVAGTMVWTDKGKVPIEEIAIGDLVLAQAEAGGPLAYKPVTRTFVYEDREIWRIDVYTDKLDATFELLLTPNHPVWVKGKGWIGAQQLALGDELQLQDGTAGFVMGAAPVFETGVSGVGIWFDSNYGPMCGPTVDLRNGDVRWDYITDGGAQTIDSRVVGFEEMLWRVYNFEVADFHTYYVGEQGLWVHNTSPAESGVAPSIFKVKLKDSDRGGKQYRVTVNFWVMPFVTDDNMGDTHCKLQKFSFSGYGFSLLTKPHHNFAAP